MAAPLPSTVTLASDDVYSGKSVRSVTKSVSAATVNETFYVPSVAYTLVGHYFFCSGVLQGTNAAQSGNAGLCYLVNQPTSSITVHLRRAAIDMTVSSAGFSLSTAPVFTLSKMSWTNSSIALPLSRTSAAVTGQPPTQTVFTTSSSGFAITKLGDIGQASVFTKESSSSMAVGYKEILPYNNPFGYQRGSCVELAPGEGLILWQSTAGSLSEVRLYTLQLEWDELDLS